MDQSNESVVVGERAVVKRWIWMAPDNRRPIVLPEHLVAAGFTEMPVPLGHAVWHHGAGVAPIASVATYLPDARDGWDRYVDLVDRSIDDPSLDAAEPAAALGSRSARRPRSRSTEICTSGSSSGGETGSRSRIWTGIRSGAGGLFRVCGEGCGRAALLGTDG